MKRLLVILTVFTLGLAPLETLQNSFGFVKGFYKVKAKETNSCNDCYGTFEDIEKIYKINKQFNDIPYISASSFIVGHTKNNTVLITSGHVCDELKKFVNSTKFKNLGLSILKYMSSNKSNFKTKILNDNYYVSREIVVYSYSGTVYAINKIIAIDREHDICLLNTKLKWGKKVEFAESDCVYEEIYNMSASGGHYYPNAMPLRKGIMNNIVAKQSYNNMIYYNVNLYTLNVKQGASGSAVFNEKGKVCGSVNISYVKLDLSSGASRSNLIQFLEKNKSNL